MGKSNFGKMGDVKMRGKKHKVLSCRCCICRDLREAKKKRRIERELLGVLTKAADMEDFQPLIRGKK